LAFRTLYFLLLGEYFVKIGVLNQYPNFVRNSEENNYYPFGLRHARYGFNSIVNNTYRYKYNGKEVQENGMYDYGWRQYLPELGRWNGMDQLSESYSSFSPYAYVVNNPVSLVDPDGRLSQDFINQINNSAGGTTWYNTGRGFSTSSGTSMDYDGNSINWGGGYVSGLLSSIGVTYTGGGIGADIAGEHTLPLTWVDNPSNVSWAWQALAYQQAFAERFNKQSNFASDRATCGYCNDRGGLQDVNIMAVPYMLVEAMLTEGLMQLGMNSDKAHSTAQVATFLYAMKAPQGVSGEIGAINKGNQINKLVPTNQTFALTSGELLRIENAATRIQKPITIVGSRASGKAGAYSDWDYIIEGGIKNSKEWSKIKNSLPGAKSNVDNTPNMIDIHSGPALPGYPAITINPRK